MAAQNVRGTLTVDKVCFDRDEMITLGERYHDDFVDAEPFPNVVIDDFLPEDVATQLEDAFPDPDEMSDYSKQDYENKIALKPWHDTCPPELKVMLYMMNSSEFVTFLEKLTDIDPLIPDPHLKGGGLHQSMDSGKLGAHVDFNLHKHFGLYRRLNAILYLNSGWEDEYGGQLGLWDHDENGDMAELVKEVAPRFNRLVVFETTETSWHGFPDPMSLPEQMTRKSLAAYYYTNDSGNQAVEPHWTRHQRRDDSTEDNVKRPIEKNLLRVTPPILHGPVRRGLDRIL